MEKDPSAKVAQSSKEKDSFSPDLYAANAYTLISSLIAVSIGRLDWDDSMASPDPDIGSGLIILVLSPGIRFKLIPIQSPNRNGKRPVRQGRPILKRKRLLLA
jgi:hypothetical protein